MSRTSACRCSTEAPISSTVARRAPNCSVRESTLADVDLCGSVRASSSAARLRSITACPVASLSCFSVLCLISASKPARRSELLPSIWRSVSCSKAMSRCNWTSSFLWPCALGISAAQQRKAMANDLVDTMYLQHGRARWHPALPKKTRRALGAFRAETAFATAPGNAQENPPGHAGRTGCLCVRGSHASRYATSGASGGRDGFAGSSFRPRRNKPGALRPSSPWPACLQARLD